MILKLTIVGLFILLIVVLTVSYYTQLEGFISTKSAADVLATSGNLLFICGPNTDIQGGKGNGKIYKASSNGRGGSVISVSQDSNASTMVSNCACLKLGANSAADVMMCTANAPAPAPAPAPALAPAPAPAPAPVNVSTSVAVPTPAQVSVSAGTASSAKNPQRNDIQPEVTVSDTSYDAMSLKQKSDLLTNIQKMFRNELLASRSMDASIKDTSSSYSKSSSTQQGNEFNKVSQKCDGPSSDEDSYRCPKNPDGSCPPIPDMTQYIKKDAIPCWGCSIDY
jgi:hypothetical protein